MRGGRIADRTAAIVSTTGAAALLLCTWGSGTVAASPAAEPASETAPPLTGPRPPIYPRLTLATHGVVGHYAHGEITCSNGVDVAECKDTGRFLGLGGDFELRVKLWRWLSLHGRVVGLGQVLGRSPYAGAVAPGAGIGAYSDLGFIRVEYLHLLPLGDGDFRSAGVSERVVERWRAPAGAISGGARLRMGHDRWRAELLGSVIIGPFRERLYELRGREEDFVISFQLGLGVSFDAIRKPARP